MILLLAIPLHAEEFPGQKPISRSALITHTVMAAGITAVFHNAARETRNRASSYSSYAGIPSLGIGERTHYQEAAHRARRQAHITSAAMGVAGALTLFLGYHAIRYDRNMLMVEVKF